MRKVKLFILVLFLFQMGCISPESKEITDPKLSVDESCGELKLFTVEPDYCKEMGLPVVEFTLQYPDNLITDPPEVGYENFAYNYFLKWDENEIQTEAFSLGYSTVQQNTFMKEDLKFEILKQVQSFWKGNGFEMTEEFMGIDKFDGEEYNMYRAKGSINSPEMEFVGDYLIQCLIVEQDVDNENGIFMMMLANEDSEIKTFEDFSNKGCVSAIWQSFAFTD